MEPHLTPADVQDQCPVKCTHELGVQGSGWRCGPGSCLHVEEATGMNRTIRRYKGKGGNNSEQDGGKWKTTA